MFSVWPALIGLPLPIFTAALSKWPRSSVSAALIGLPLPIFTVLTLHVAVDTTARITSEWMATLILC